jgi:hypothetical protein
VDELSRRLATTPAVPAEVTKKPTSWLAWLGTSALLVWKFGKLLLMGLTKGSTFLSMLVAFSVYWTLWGWKFAAGFVLSIYVHEKGHV